MKPKDSPDFAQKLNLLFETVTKPDNSPFSHDEVYQATGVTPGYISKLRSGKTKNPGFEVIHALASFFNVSASYFFEEEGETVKGDARKALLEHIALRAQGLDEDGVKALSNMLETIYRLQNKEDGSET